MAFWPPATKQLILTCKCTYYTLGLTVFDFQVHKIYMYIGKYINILTDFDHLHSLKGLKTTRKQQEHNEFFFWIIRQYNIRHYNNY